MQLYELFNKGVKKLTVYKGSRYAGSKLYYDSENQITYIETRKPKFDPQFSDIQIQITAGMRLDLLAKKYYNDPQLDWVILDANPQYKTPEDIAEGDIITIPHARRVVGNV